MKHELGTDKKIFTKTGFHYGEVFVKAGRSVHVGLTEIRKRNPPS